MKKLLLLFINLFIASVCFAQSLTTVNLGDGKADIKSNKVTFSKWDEVSMDVSIPIVSLPSQENEKFIWKDTDKEIIVYSLEPTPDYTEGGLEIEIKLNKRPVGDFVELPIQTQGLEFYRQPPLTEEFELGIIKADSCTETECILNGEIVAILQEKAINSYAVYHSEKQGDYTALGGKNYRIGKVMTIWRPQITDSNNKKTWGVLTIDKQAGKLRIDIDPNVAYPIIIDPTFGYTTQPTGTASSIENTITGSNDTSASAGTGSKITVWLNGLNVADKYVKCALYQRTGYSFVMGTEERLMAYTGWVDNWYDFNFTSPPSISTIAYVIVGWSSSAAGNFNMQRDNASSSFNRYLQGVTYGAWPDPIAPSETSTLRYGIYVTYAEPVSATTQTIFIQ